MKNLTKLLLISQITFSSFTYANSNLNTIIMINNINMMNRNNSSGYTLDDTYKAKIKLTKLKQTRACKELWDDSSFYNNDKLELEVRIKSDSEHLGADNQSESFTSTPIKISPDKDGNLNQTIDLEFSYHLNVGNVYVTLADTDRIMGMDFTDYDDDVLHEFNFDYHQTSKKFDGTCFSGEVIVTDEYSMGGYEKQSAKSENIAKIKNLTAGDTVLITCSSQVLPIKLDQPLKFNTSTGRFMVKGTNLHKTSMDYCFDDSAGVYADRLISTTSEKKVNDYNSFKVGDIVEEKEKNYLGFNTIGRISTIYASGYVHLELLSNSTGKEGSVISIDKIEKFQKAQLDEDFITNFSVGDRVRCGYTSTRKKHPDYVGKEATIENISYNYTEQIIEVKLDSDECIGMDSFTSKLLDGTYSSTIFVEHID